MHQISSKFAWEQKFDKTLSEIHFSQFKGLYLIYLIRELLN